MAVVLDDIASYLQTQGVGTVGTDLFKAMLPDTPDACVAVLEFGGDEPVDTYSVTAGTIKVERPALQIICRAAQDDYSAARTKAESAYKQLHNLGPATLSGTVYLGVKAREAPFTLGRDSNGRWLVGFNLSVWKEPNA
jgi:hypothetical protein